jgi:DNA end-binding protein Ku
VKKKEKKGIDVVTAPAGAPAAASEGVIDLMEVLKRSLQGASGGTAKRAAKRGEPATGGKAAKSTRKTASKKNGGSSAKASAKGRGGAKWTKSHLRKQSKEELYETAKELDIEGRSGMTKDELIEAIQNAAS